MTNKPLVSVLIGSRDRPVSVIRCLHSVFSQDYHNLEVLVLDDNSSRYRLDELLASVFRDRRLRCFRSDISLGVASGRNFLMQWAKGEILCFIDDDAYFADSGCVSRIVEAFARNPQVGILATKIVDHQPSGENLFVPFSRWWRLWRRHLAETPQLVSYYVGGCHAIRRRVIEQCGNYQNDLFFGGEEMDLSYRAVQAGIQIMYLPSVVVHHYPAPSVANHHQSRYRSELYFYVRNRFFLAFKYLPSIYIPVYLSVWLCIYGLSALRRGAFREFLSGLLAGVIGLKNLQRTPLNQQAVTYLKSHYGRLWY